MDTLNKEYRNAQKKEQENIFPNWFVMLVVILLFVSIIFTIYENNKVYNLETELNNSQEKIDYWHIKYNQCRIDYLTCESYHFLNYSKQFYEINRSRCILFENNKSICLIVGDKSYQKK